MYKVLLVDDDVHILNANETYLARQGYQVSRAENGELALRLASSAAFDAIVLDVDMPGMDGVTVCRRLREVSGVPIIFLSSASDNMNVVMAMNMGGDDFIAKPFDLSVLTAKINAVLRRAYSFSGNSDLISHGSVILDISSAVVTNGDKKAELTKNELRILRTLMENAGRIISRDTLMQRLWETDCFIDENTLTVNVSRLRKKLENIGLENYITTKVGMWYMIV